MRGTDVNGMIDADFDRGILADNSHNYHTWLVDVGGRPTPLKNDGVRQLGLLFPTEWKVIKFMVPNHQPDTIGKLEVASLAPQSESLPPHSIQPR